MRSNDIFTTTYSPGSDPLRSPEQFKDTQTGQENWVAILDDPNPADVIDQMKKLMEKIKQNAQSELDKIDVATALSKQTGCEVVADLFAETEE